jgi:sterol desaturase/sphingolipid hydroxylase (fatty acid hydroxylase superfamily)
MPPILYAVPVFMALLLIEVLASRWMGRDVYRVHDAITSVNIGFISEAVRSLVKLVTVIFYALFVERVGTFQFDIKQPWVWVLAFFMYDFLYYWAHRAGHEVRLLWAAHVVHHSSEDFNLSRRCASLRRTSCSIGFFTCRWPLSAFRRRCLSRWPC